jgi:hypothetical protein
MEGDMDELSKVEYAEWLRWCGYVDAELNSNPLDDDPDYMAGFAERYAELECEGNRYGM